MGHLMNRGDGAPGKFHGEGFRKQISASLVNARRYASILGTLLRQSQSVAAIGCSRRT
jgi:hypothetical protein